MVKHWLILVKHWLIFFFEGSLYTLYCGFKKISFTLYTYVLPKILQNGAKFIQKLTPAFKNHMRNLDNVRQAVESQKSWATFV